MDLGEDEAEKSRRNILEDSHYLVGHFGDFQVQALPPETVGEVQADVVLVRLDGDRWMKFYFDPQSHLLLKDASMQPNMITDMVALQESSYSDWHEVDGVLYPSKVHIVHGGEPLMDVQNTLLELDLPLDDSLFEPPQS